jgi:two-component system sensor histidine kinase KdpD
VVVVAAQAGAGAMTISVVDNGPGIRPGREREIFDKFTRGERESSLSGVGLGLAICKSIVEAHGGTIVAENVDPHGAAFRISLPLGAGPSIEASDPAEVERAT